MYVNMQRRTGFTLIELLMVLAIMAVIMAWLLPSLQRSRDYTRLVTCQSNNKQLGNVIIIYTEDHQGYFPVPALREYFTGPPLNLDVSWTWMEHFVGGDDIGDWTVVDFVPANVRPLARYINPYSAIYRCPSDDGISPHWDVLCTSYRYNANPAFGNDGLYAVRLDEVTWPSLTIEIGDSQWGSTRPNLPSNDLWTFTNDPRVWWHPEAFRNRKAALGFVDGHAEYTLIQIMVPNTDHYRRDP